MHFSSLDPFIKFKGKWSVVNTTPAGYVVLKLLFLDVLLTDQWLLPWIEEIQYEEILDATNGNIK